VATTLVKVHNLAGKNAMILGGYMAIPSYSLAHLCATYIRTTYFMYHMYACTPTSK